MTVIDYTECPACGEIAEIEDGSVQEKVTYQEKKQRIATERMIRKIIPRGINYRVDFLLRLPSSKTDLICRHCPYYKKFWGWTYKDKAKNEYIIYIPRKTFFLPRDEFVDTVVAHEPMHALFWENKHGREWYFSYRDNRKVVFRKFSRFIDAKNTLPIKFRKRDKIYLSDYEDEYEEEQKRLILLKKKRKSKITL